MQSVVNIQEAKTQLSRLVDRAAAGEEIVVARNGRPVARLVALDSRDAPRRGGWAQGEITIGPRLRRAAPGGHPGGLRGPRVRLLLDAHVLLWWAADDAQLAEAARDAINASLNEVFLSAATAWELAIKVAAGRLEVPDDLVARALREGLRPLPIDHRSRHRRRRTPPASSRSVRPHARRAGTAREHDARHRRRGHPALRRAHLGRTGISAPARRMDKSQKATGIGLYSSRLRSHATTES